MSKLTFFGAAVLAVIATRCFGAGSLDSETYIPVKTGHVPYAPQPRLQTNRIAPPPANANAPLKDNQFDQSLPPVETGAPNPAGSPIPPLDSGTPPGSPGASPSTGPAPILPVVPNPRGGPAGVTP
jgi:hypothetical protein